MKNINLAKKTWSFLTSKQKKYGIFIFVMMFITMFFETLSVGIVLPLLSLFLKGDTEEGILSFPFIFRDMLGENLIYVALLLALIIFLLKNFILSFNLWYQTKFLRNLNFDITSRLFKYYLKKDYLFFINNNSAFLYRNLTSVITSTIDYINRYMIFLTESIVFIGIMIFLSYIDFLGTSIILLSVSIVASLVYFIFRKRIKFFANQRNIVGGDLNKHLLQGMASAKDVKILDREEELISQVGENLQKMTKISHIVTFVNGLPRYIFEVFIVLMFIVLVILMLNVKRELIDIIQYLGVFAVASFRIIPSVTRIVSSLQMINFQEPSVNILFKEFDLKKKASLNKNINMEKKNIPINFKNYINIKNLSFSFPSRKEFSLSKITLSVKKGEFIGIIGETGSGKSTLINLLTGLLKPSDGKIEVDGSDIHLNLKSWHEKIGYVPQSIYLTDDSIKKNIAFGLREDNINNNLINKAVENSKLNFFLKDLEDGVNTVVGEKGIKLSGGQQQRIGIARALYRDPEILILDEGTSSLDETTERKIMESISLLKRKKTIILVTHRLYTVKNCDKVYFIDKGKIIKEGSPGEVLNND